MELGLPVRILVVNAGSSSLRLRVLGPHDEMLASHDLAPDDPLPADLPEVDAIGHRVVHGGSDFTGPVVVDTEVLGRLHALADLAPLHQERSLAALAEVAKVFQDVPTVACFDTAFHTTMPAAATTYALPETWRTRFGLRRFGFHGLSHAYAARRSATLLGRGIEDLKLVTCHLGAGASLAAVAHGRSVDTTMGFTPLDGLVMATRSGSVDPGLILWLLEHGHATVPELGEALEHASGILGLAGTDDMRTVLARSDPGAQLAVEVYVHRLCAGIAAMTASLGGLDALVFTGGVGENSPAVRRLACQRLAWWGLAVDDRNDHAEDDRQVSPAGARVPTLVVHAREDLEIAREVREVLT